MKHQGYETLGEYLADMNAIKAQITEETRGLTPKEVVAYFAKAQRELEEKTGMKVKVRRPRRPRRRAAAGKR